MQLLLHMCNTMSQIRTRLYQKNDFTVFTAGDGMPAIRLDEEAERRYEAAEWIETLEEWIGDAEHHAGCSGGYAFQRCKCGLTEIIKVIDDE